MHGKQIAITKRMNIIFPFQYSFEHKYVEFYIWIAIGREMKEMPLIMIVFISSEIELQQ